MSFPPKPKNPQPKVPIPSQVQSMLDFSLDLSNESPRKRLSPKHIRFDPIPMSYIELLPILVQSELVISTPNEPMKPSYPRWYDKNAH